MQSPISGTDVILRSFHSLTSYLSLHRPWTEFISGSYERPESLNLAATRFQVNSKYFRVNYAIITTACTTLSLIRYPTSLLLFTTVLTLWLVLYFFREDPMVVYEHHVSDRIVLVTLALITEVIIWNIGSVRIKCLLIGLVVGVLIWFAHCVFRNTDGIYLDENDAVSQGLVSPSSASFEVYNSPI